MAQRKIVDVTNYGSTAFMLDSGQQLGPARSRTAKLEGVELTDLDRRRIQALGTVRVTNERNAPAEEGKEGEAATAATEPAPQVRAQVAVTTETQPEPAKVSLVSEGTGAKREAKTK